jgi:iduronate 2-sulfatase
VLSLRRAYFASISYVDSLVGQVLRSLSDLGLDSNTVVMFVGDHGWQLGEHGEWCKHTNFELAVRAPMILRIPQLTDHGFHIDELVEFVDVFPTIADAAGLRVPKLCPENSRKVPSITCVL